MISEDGKWQICDGPDCSERVKNHMWGAIKADDWFFQKDGSVWCPKHIPDWVPEWRDQQEARRLLTQSERATYQSLRSRGCNHKDALSDALDGVDVHDVRADADHGDFTTPEGYDDSPDQGVHRFDGGGVW